MIAVNHPFASRAGGGASLKGRIEERGASVYDAPVLGRGGEVFHFAAGTTVDVLGSCGNFYAVKVFGRSEPAYVHRLEVNIMPDWDRTSEKLNGACPGDHRSLPDYGPLPKYDGEGRSGPGLRPQSSRGQPEDDSPVYEYEPYGWPEFVGSLAGAIGTYGILGAIAGLPWGWATGHVGAGMLAGCVLGGLLGSFFGLVPASYRSRSRRREMAFGMSALIGTPLIILAAFGLVAGVISHAV